MSRESSASAPVVDGTVGARGQCRDIRSAPRPGCGKYRHASADTRKNLREDVLRTRDGMHDDNL